VFIDDTTKEPAAVVDDVGLNSAIPKSNGPPNIDTEPVNWCMLEVVSPNLLDPFPNTLNTSGLEVPPSQLYTLKPPYIELLAPADAVVTADVPNCNLES